MLTSTRRHLLSKLAGACVLAALPWVAQAQTYPGKAVTIIVPFPAGGGPDLAARVLAEKLAPRFGQPVVVENRPGAGALLGASAVARSTPDGHTLLLTPNTMVISPHVLAPGAGSGVDVHKDLVPVIAPATTPLVLVAHPQLGATTLKAAIEAARKSPGIPYGSAGNGSPMHFAGEMLKRSAQVDLLHVPYRGVAPSITGALSGEVKLLYVGLGGAVRSQSSCSVRSSTNRATSTFPGRSTANPSVRFSNTGRPGTSDGSDWARK